MPTPSTTSDDRSNDDWSDDDRSDDDRSDDDWSDDETTDPDPRWRRSPHDEKITPLSSADATTRELTTIAAPTGGAMIAPATVAMTKIAVHKTRRTRSSRQTRALVAENHHST